MVLAAAVVLAGLLVGQHGGLGPLAPGGDPDGAGHAAGDAGSGEPSDPEEGTTEQVAVGPAEEPAPGADLDALETAAETGTDVPAGTEELDEVTRAPGEPDPQEQQDALDEAVEQHESAQDEAAEDPSLDALQEAGEPAPDPDVVSDLENEAGQQQQELAEELEDVLPE